MPALPIPPPAPGPGRPVSTRFAAGLWFIWAVSVLAIASIAARTGPAVPSPWPPEIARSAPPLARWDSGWYLSIARDGYSWNPTHPQNNVGFYPLFPLATRALAAATRLPIFSAGIAISLAGTLVALILLARLKPPGGADALLALLLFPPSFFLAAFYAEGTCLAASVAAFYLARRRLWIPAGLAAGAACFTRINGITLLPALVWLAIESRRDDRGKDDAIRMTALGIAMIGAAAYPVYLWRKFGDPLLYFHDKLRGWPSMSFGRFWRPILVILHQAHVFALHPNAGGKLAFAAEVGALALLLWSVAWCARRRRIAELFYSSSLLALILLAGNPDGLHRYVAATFPCFFPLGELLSRSKAVRIAYVVAGAAGGALLLVHFVRWKFVG